MARVFSERPRQVLNLYLQVDRPTGVSVSNLRQMKYLPFLNATPDFE